MYKQGLKATAFFMLCASLNTTAATVDIQVKNSNGSTISLNQAIVYAVPSQPVDATNPETNTTIVQRNLQFDPYISVVQRNTKVMFPNRDNTSHHVYSFSSAKSFTLPLYKKQQPSPVLFDKAGLVVLGCNIHDWMLAYLLVVDTPYFTQLNSKNQQLNQLPPGSYQLHLWHPQLDKRDLAAMTVVVIDGKQSVTFSLKHKLKPNFRPKVPGQSFDNDEY